MSRVKVYETLSRCNTGFLRHLVISCWLTLLVTFSSTAPGFASKWTPWPLGSWENADHSLSRLDPSFKKNLSGSHWDPANKELLLVVNKPGTIVILSYTSGGFIQKHRFRYPGDLEGVTRVPQFADDIFVIEEKNSEILRFRVTRATLKFIQSWDLSPFLPDSGKLGAEGIAFIPDRDLDKLPLAENRNGEKNLFGGIFCIAHQNGGNLYFFELLGKDVRYIGNIQTRSGESSGLEYDTVGKRLYIWHNGKKNSLEIVHLEPDGKKLQLAAHFKGPKKGNLESVAVGPLGNSTSLFLTDDDNQDNASILWYRNWPDIQ